MSFVDMAYLRKSDLRNGVLTYRRRKTGQRLTVKWERCMQQVVDKYAPTQTDYLLPIIRPTATLVVIIRMRSTWSMCVCIPLANALACQAV